MMMFRMKGAELLFGHLQPLSPARFPDRSGSTSRVRKGSILLQKSIFADDQNSAGRGRDFRVQDAGDLTASRKIHRRLR
jgi:hypothetical protein